MGQGVPGSNHRNTEKNIKKNLLLQNQLAQMLEIQYVILSGGPLPSLFSHCHWPGGPRFKL